MSRGPSVLIVGLFAATLLVVLVIAIIIAVVGWGSESGFNFLDLVWRTFLTTLDPGTVANFLGGTSSPGYLLALLGATLFGIFVISTLIGVLDRAPGGQLDELRKGHSKVIESDHTVILGWSPQIFTILSEVVWRTPTSAAARSSCWPPATRSRWRTRSGRRSARPGRTRIVCRTGSPMDLTDLARAGIETAKSVIVLPPEVDDPDADVIKTILAITNDPNRRAEPYHIVAELRERDSLAVARIVGRDEAQLVLVGDLIARIVAQTCRQSGLSVVYQELLDFEGDEIYEAEPPARLVGRPSASALFAYETSTVIGLLRPTAWPASTRRWTRRSGRATGCSRSPPTTTRSCRPPVRSMTSART